MTFSAQKSLYPKAAVILSVQRFLSTCFVIIADAGDAYDISIRPKNASTPEPMQEAFANALLEAVFIQQHFEETKEIRRLLLEKALSPHRRPQA
jgi:His-Xaa-Ser system protein HxsD